jgi:hypothetical protein
MGVAAAGHLTPVAGALLQEVIDLAVILNACARCGLTPRAWRTESATAFHWGARGAHGPKRPRRDGRARRDL